MPSPSAKKARSAGAALPAKRRLAITSDSVAIPGFLIIYFLSGFSALLYQVVWQRMLTIFSGSDLYATITIVAAFMAGLGAGSLAGGFIADRLGLSGQTRLFALAELLVGAFAMVSTWWYYDVLYVRHSALAESPVILAAILFGSLLIPTFCMGMSFPLISKALTPSIEQAGARIGLLYAINTLGAAAGAFAAAWLLMGDLAFPDILRIGALLNALIAALAIVLGPGLRRTESAAPPARVEKVRAGFSFGQWMLIYTLSGFVALSLEIVWFRLLGVMLKSNSFTFPHLLAVYLGSLALGIMAGALVVRRAARAEQVCLGLQAGVIVSATLSLSFFLWIVDSWPAMEQVNAYLAGYEPFDVSVVQRAIHNALSSPVNLLRATLRFSPSFASLYLAVPLALVALPSLLMGLSFPFLQRAVQNRREELGRRVGWLQAVNIFGATLGAVLTGAVLLHHAGAAWTLRGLVVVGGVFLFLWASRFAGIRARRRAYVCVTGVLAWLVWTIPDGDALWAKLHGAKVENIIVAEDGTGVSLLKNANSDFSDATAVFVNGLGQSWVPFGGVHSQLGILPILLHPEPADVAVIGLGSGDTAYSLGGREATTSITCIEIVAPQIETLRRLHALSPYGGLEGLLTDPRFHFVFGDGRSFLARNDRKFDVIEADALRPNSAFAGNLYSYEYFLLLKSRLKPGGLAVTWAPTPRVVATFARAFPNVFQIDSTLVGSVEPIPYDPDAIRARLQLPFTQNYYAKAGINVNAMAEPLLHRRKEDLQLNLAGLPQDDLNTDLHPRDEYNR